MIDSPVASAISPDGVILVLEIGNNRIQAFDLGANPVQHFTKQSPPYSLTPGATDPALGWQYLNLAVEYTGYLYVLSLTRTRSYIGSTSTTLSRQTPTDLDDAEHQRCEADGRFLAQCVHPELRGLAAPGRRGRAAH